MRRSFSVVSAVLLSAGLLMLEETALAGTATTAAGHAHDSASRLPYAPVVTPNGSTLPWTMENGAKVFRLTVEPCKHEIAPGMVINAWCYNGQTPGPTIEAVEGDRVRPL